MVEESGLEPESNSSRASATARASMTESLGRLDKGARMRLGGRGELAKCLLLRRMRHLRWRCPGAESETRGCVLAFKDKSLTENLISLRVRGALENGIDLEVRLDVSDGRVDLIAILKKKEVAEEGRRVLAEPPFAVGRPHVFRVTDRLFGPVVEVVPETGSNLRLELNGKKQPVLVNNQEIPLLLRSVITGKFNGCTGFDVAGLKTGVDQNVREEQFKSAHLSSAGYSATRPRIDLARVNLFLLLPPAGIPEGLHGGFEALVETG